MSEPPPETLAWLRQTAAVDGAAYSQVLLHLLERLEALEQRPIPGFVELAAPTPEAAPVATDEELWSMWADCSNSVAATLRACYDLGRQHGAAQPPADQPAPPVAPVGGLVERLACKLAIEMSERRVGPGTECTPIALAAIREVAAWLWENELFGDPAALSLEQEADR
jgi:hypothetical protein